MNSKSLTEPETNVGEIAALVAEQNDLFRAGAADPTAWAEAARKGIYGRVLLTPGVSGAGEAFVAEALAAVATFDAFTEDNDPYEDHSFAALDVGGQRLFWKLDLYDTSYVWGSASPSDPSQTRRVLTIMTPSEY